MFDKKAYIAKQTGAVNKLIAQLKTKGLILNFLTQDPDNELENVVFVGKNKTIKMSHHSFYRFSGICCVVKEKTKESVDVIEVTDEMYLQSYIKPILEVLLA